MERRGRLLRLARARLRMAWLPLLLGLTLGGWTAGCRRAGQAPAAVEVDETEWRKVDEWDTSQVEETDPFTVTNAKITVEQAAGASEPTKWTLVNTATGKSSTFETPPANSLWDFGEGMFYLKFSGAPAKVALWEHR